jgi:putative oxidoreductase
MMARALRNRWLLLLLRLVLGSVFVYAGAIKLRASQPFADSIATFRLLPIQGVDLLAMGLPVFELMVGGLLIFGWLRRAASLAAVLMTGVFALALTSALARGLPVDCGCFGSGAASTFQTWLSFMRDMLMGTIAILLYLQALGGRLELRSRETR